MPLSARSSMADGVFLFFFVFPAFEFDLNQQLHEPLVEFYSVVVCVCSSCRAWQFHSIATYGPLNRRVTANKAPPISLAGSRPRLLHNFIRFYFYFPKSKFLPSNLLAVFYKTKASASNLIPLQIREVSKCYLSLDYFYVPRANLRPSLSLLLD